MVSPRLEAEAKRLGIIKSSSLREPWPWESGSLYEPPYIAPTLKRRFRVRLFYILAVLAVIGGILAALSH